MLRSWVCFDTWFWGWDMAWDGPMLTGRSQTFWHEVAHLLKLQDIQNSSQTSSLIDQFCWLEMAYFSLFLTKLLRKVVQLFSTNSAKLVGDQNSLCHCKYFYMVELVSYVYEKFPTNMILRLTGRNRTLVLLSRNIIRKRCFYKTS